MIVAHLDLDAFFAAVEELEQPELRTRAARRRRRPARPRRRRDRELRRAALRDPLGDVVRRGASPLPAGRLRPARGCALPRLLARGLVDRARDRADRRAGRDRRGLSRPRRGRARLRRRARARRGGPGGRPRRTRLSCSLGVANSKVVAKVASDRRKPGGLTVVRPGREAEFLAPFPIRVLPGDRPAGRGAARGGRGRDDRRGRGARRRRARRSCRARSGGSSASGRAASTRGRSRSRPSGSRSRTRRPSSATSATSSGCTTSCAGWPAGSPTICANAGRPPAR